MSARNRVATATPVAPPAIEAGVFAIRREAGSSEGVARRNGHGGADAQAEALAARRCAARVAAALKRLGYGFAMIPATAKPKRTGPKA